MAKARYNPLYSAVVFKDTVLEPAHSITAQSRHKLHCVIELRLFKIRGVPEVQAPSPLPKSQPFFARRHSTIFKLLGVVALVLVLLIPLALITGVLNERLQRRNEAVTDITSSWGKEQM